MIKLNNHQYELVLLDTNAIREIALNSYSSGKGFFEYFGNRANMFCPCVSWYSIVELKPYTDIFAEFQNVFTKIPTLISMPYKTILISEYEAFINKREVPVEKEMLSPLSMELLNQVFNTQNQLLSKIDDDLDVLPEIAQAWENQRADFMIPFSKVKNQESQCIRKFLESFEIQVNSSALNIEDLPASRLMSYIQFMKTHAQRKPLKPNDVVDFMISAIVPYVDVVITEKNQGDLYHQAKHIKSMDTLKILTLRDIRLNQ